MTNLPETLMLAYLGDAVIELLVREHLIKEGFISSADANREALKFVTATAQCEAAKKIMPLLTEEEADMFRLGKNARPHSTPRNVSSYTYHLATGFEVVFGYNHFLGKDERNLVLFDSAYRLCSE